MADASKTRPATDKTSSVIVDVTDLVCYIGVHPHLTGVQRVQAAIVACLLESTTPTMFVSFAATAQRFVKLDPEILRIVLRDLSLPLPARALAFDRADAALGRLPGCEDIAYEDPDRDGTYCVVMLGTAWIVADYFRHLNILRDAFRAGLVCVVHDLVPIYASETCHAETAKVFRRFLRESRHVTNLYVCVSASTERDLLRYFDVNDWPRPRTTIIRHGTMLPSPGEPRRPDWLRETPQGHVLFVSTIEARKNHAFLFKVWSRLLFALDADLPRLICIGRIGWHASEFLIEHIASNGLSQKVEIRSDVADRELAYLYETARFTVYPSLYEGWGLPISESLAYGKLCVCSNRASMPEAGGDLAVYIDPTDLAQACETIEALIRSPAAIESREEAIRTRFERRSWRQVAADYLATIEACADETPLTVIPQLPARCVFRRSRTDFDDATGDGLLALVEAHLRSDVQADPLQPSDFENGRNARWTGDWNIQEDWGCWIGMRGATLCFHSADAERYVARFACFVLDPFKGALLEIRVNDVSSYHRLSSRPDAILDLEFTAEKGRNTISFRGSPTAAQAQGSLAIDPRGLMLGLREMVCVAAGAAIGPGWEERGDKAEHGEGSSTMPTEAAGVVRNAFAGGTSLLTERGEVPVEQLAPGDRVATYSGRYRPVRRIVGGWAEGTAAIRIPAGAVGEGKPKRDLRVTADAQVCLKIVSECLVPVDRLVEKSTFEAIAASGETFWQIVLDEDDVVLPEGLPIQSGPDVDHLQFDQIDDRRLIEMIRAILKGRAAALGWHLVATPPLDLHVVADGTRIEPEIDGATFRFVVPASASEVWLVSECSVPKEVGFNADGRLLGACLTSMLVEDGLGVSRQIALDDPLLDAGFQQFEGTQRWTDGCARLSPQLWRACRDPFFLTVSLAMSALPRYCRPQA